MRMIGKHFRDRFTQRAGAVAVDYAYFGNAVQESFVEKLVHQIDGFVGLLAD